MTNNWAEARDNCESQPDFETESAAHCCGRVLHIKAELTKPYHLVHNSRSPGLGKAIVDTNNAMIMPPVASVCGTPKRCDTATAIKLPIGIAPIKESTNILLTRPRISSRTSVCSSVLV